MNPLLLPGEFHYFPKEIDNICILDRDKIISENGKVWITNFRIIFRFSETVEFSVTFGNIVNINKTDFQKTYEIYLINCRDLAQIKFGIHVENNFKNDLFKLIEKYAHLPNIKELFCFSQALSYKEGSGWDILNLQKEFSRQNLNFENWKITAVNKNWQISNEYPSECIVPALMKDNEVISVGAARNKGQFPFLLWSNVNLSGKLYLFRSSQLKEKSHHDVNFLNEILRISSASHIHIVELGMSSSFFPLRSLYSGFYAEKCKISFLNLPNENALTECLKFLSSSFAKDPLDNLEPSYQTKWLNHCFSYLQGASEVIGLLADAPVILQSRELYTLPVVSSLVQIILDPYYRTIHGFCMLITKDFIQFSHKFNCFPAVNRAADPYSASILLFVDCVWQLLQKFASFFEFQESLLVYIIDSVYSCQFGTFLPTNESERVDFANKTPSVWSYILSNFHLFLNPLFFPSNERMSFTLLDRSHIALWKSFYLRHRSRLLSLNSHKAHFNYQGDAFSPNPSPSMKAISREQLERDLLLGNTHSGTVRLPSFNETEAIREDLSAPPPFNPEEFFKSDSELFLATGDFTQCLRNMEDFNKTVKYARKSQTPTAEDITTPFANFQLSSSPSPAPSLVGGSNDPLSTLPALPFSPALSAFIPSAPNGSSPNPNESAAPVIQSKSSSGPIERKKPSDKSGAPIKKKMPKRPPTKALPSTPGRPPPPSNFPQPASHLTPTSQPPPHEVPSASQPQTPDRPSVLPNFPGFNGHYQVSATPERSVPLPSVQQVPLNSLPSISPAQSPSQQAHPQFISYPQGISSQGLPSIPFQVIGGGYYPSPHQPLPVPPNSNLQQQNQHPKFPSAPQNIPHFPSIPQHIPHPAAPPQASPQATSPQHASQLAQQQLFIQVNPQRMGSAPQLNHQFPSAPQQMYPVPNNSIPSANVMDNQHRFNLLTHGSSPNFGQTPNHSLPNVSQSPINQSVPDIHQVLLIHKPMVPEPNQASERPGEWLNQVTPQPTRNASTPNIVRGSRVDKLPPNNEFMGFSVPWDWMVKMTADNKICFYDTTEDKYHMPPEPGWAISKNAKGKLYFIHHPTQSTHWKIPPPGWSIRKTPQGKLYYVDHINKKTQWDPPS